VFCALVHVLHLACGVGGDDTLVNSSQRDPVALLLVENQCALDLQARRDVLDRQEEQLWPVLVLG
jgi:hypothetical protein